MMLTTIKKQIFSPDETAFYWKRISPRTSITREKSKPHSKDSLSLLLGANAAGNLRLNPALISS